MPIMDFPNSPTLNQEFVGGDNKWKWDGAKWVSVTVADETLVARNQAVASATAAAADALAADADALAAVNAAAAAVPAASAAAASEIAAASSAASAALALDSFDDRYLGSKTTPPTLDNDGAALVTGSLYYRSTGTLAQQGMWVWDGTNWLKASSYSPAALNTFEYTATASQITFTGDDRNAVPLVYVAGSIGVYLNGILLSPGDDYTATDGTSLVLGVGATSGDDVLILAYSTFTVASVYSKAEIDALLAGLIGLPSGLVGLDEVQTITNKTLTSPTINTPTINTPTITNGLLTGPREVMNIVATAATGTVNVNIGTSAFWYYTTNASANFTLNFRRDAGVSLNTMLSTGQSVTVTFLVTNGGVAYYPNVIQIDTVAVTPKWQFGVVPTAGSVNSIDSYTFVITKTGNATFIVLGASMKFA